MCGESKRFGPDYPINSAPNLGLNFGRRKDRKVESGAMHRRALNGPSLTPRAVHLIGGSRVGHVQTLDRHQRLLM